MKLQYKTAISDRRWIAYDIPGNIGWITWLVCAVRGLREKRDIHSLGAMVPAVFTLTGVVELIQRVTEADAREIVIKRDSDVPPEKRREICAVVASNFCRVFERDLSVVVFLQPVGHVPDRFHVLAVARGFMGLRIGNGEVG